VKQLQPIRLDTLDRKQLAKAMIDSIPVEPPRMVKFVLADSQRSLDQNALMWVLLGQLAKRATWHKQKLHAEAWKDLCSAGLKAQDLIPGINGGFVALGERTSKMSIKKMSELIEFIYWFGTDCPPGLEWSGFIQEQIPNEYLQYLE
jgi:hypothetical protein